MMTVMEEPRSRFYTVNQIFQHEVPGLRFEPATSEVGDEHK